MIKSAEVFVPSDIMGINVKRANLKRIDRDRRVVEFSTDIRPGKITGSRFLAVLGRDPYMSDFKAACLIARVIYDDTKTKQTEAGDAIEPIIRSYVRENRETILRDIMGVNGDITVEDPVDKKDCYYNHFRDEVFGGLVDGFIGVDGKRYAILEIKTTGDRSNWFNEDGSTRIPEGYILQASLYAHLSKLERIVFAVGFLEEKDYEHPEGFIPNEDNTLFLCVDKKDIASEMAQARGWYDRYIRSGVTPEWKDGDAGIVDVLTSDRINEMPGDAMMLFKRYARYYDSDEDLTDMEYTIMDIMSSAAAEGVDKVIYSQNGFTFTLSLEGVPRLTVTPDDRSSEASSYPSSQAGTRSEWS
ncbi:MAG: YqaJ viral recombinase family protein [Candidatus Methanomethylophilaceae archaeon]|nr:YqaJ viral recombinase family protein [Candidatus Methanomethylophilaceae archaeon]